MDLLKIQLQSGRYRSLVDALQVSWIQLHGDVDPANLPRLKALLPRLRIIKSLVIGKYPAEQLEKMVQLMAPYVDAFITDTYNPANGAEGATGLTHDWRISRALQLACPRPLILAGGLNADNVADAIRTVRPWGVDVHTGIEDASGRKSPRLTRLFVEAARAAFAEG